MFAEMLLAARVYEWNLLTNPLSKLHIAGNAILDSETPYLYTGSSSAEQNRYLHIGNSPSTSTVSGMKAGGMLIADTYTYANPAKNDLIVKGRIGIIDTPLLNNPNDYVLAVNGKVGAKDVQIERESSTWPDYVFKSNYTTSFACGSWAIHQGSWASERSTLSQRGCAKGLQHERLRYRIAKKSGGADLVYRETLEIIPNHP